MDNSLINDLEHAAQVLLAAPDVVTADQRREAEHVFITFHKTVAPYAVCKHILETSKNQYVVYQAAATLQESLIREWLTLDRQDIESLRIYLMHYIIEKAELQSYVREQIVQTIAVIHKRYSVDSDSRPKDDPLFTDIAHLVHSGTQSAQLVACSILSALLHEYASGARTSCMGLTWEQHNRCKIAFEQHEMKQVLVFCICTLAELNKCYDSTSLDSRVTALVSRILGVVEQVLSWEYASRCHVRKHVGTFNGCQSNSFKPPASWRDVVLDKGLIDILITTYRKVKRSHDLVHQVLLCVAQLASTNGSIFGNETSHVEYLTYVIKSFLDLVSSDAVQPEEVLDVANVLYNIVTIPSLAVVEQLPPDVLSAFLTFLAQSTCTFCRAAAAESNDESMYIEAFDRLLETWMKFVSKYNELPSDMLKHHAAEIMNVYLHCHLGPPDGSRCQSAEEEGKEYDEMEEDDKDKFSYQLLSIGSFGRLVPEYSLPLLTMLLNERLHRLEGTIRTLQNCNQDSAADQKAYQQALDGVNEDLHWLLLISANILADSLGGGETPTMPSSVARSSPSTLTGAMLSQLKSCLTAEGSDTGATEPVVNLLAAAFRLCQLQRTFTDCNLGSWFSPQVSRSLCHLLTRWSCSYLFLDVSCYSKLASEIGVVFGRSDVDILRWTASCLIDYVKLNLTTCTGEVELIEEALNLFTSLVEHKERCDVAVQCESLWNLAQDFSLGHHQLSSLSPQSRRQLCRALVLASAADFVNSSKDTYIQIVFKSIQDRLKSIVSRGDLRSICHEQSIKLEVLQVLDCLCSVADAARSDNINSIFEFLHPMIIDAISLLDLYHNYDEVIQQILQLFNVMAKQLTCFLNDKDCRTFYDMVLSMMQTFAKHNIGRRNLSKDTEEEQFAAILALMDILTNLLSKDFIDFASDETDGNTQGKVCAADVVLYGLNIIVPLMTAELLKFPALCTAYMALLAYMAEIHAARLCRLPDDLLHRLMSAVEHGLTSNAGSDIAKACLELIASIASHVCTDEQLIGTSVHTTGSHFLEIMFNMLLLNTFDMDLLETASSAFYALICSHQAAFNELVNKLLAAQSGSPYYHRLLEAFNTLTAPGQRLTIDRASRVKFLQNFDRFLVEVRSFLCVR